MMKVVWKMKAQGIDDPVVQADAKREIDQIVDRSTRPVQVSNQDQGWLIISWSRGMQ